ncbi:MAG TPA: hypothetical protein VGE74_25755 [Gemmata sp.]
MSTSYTAIHDDLTGRFQGVLRDDGAQVPRDEGNADWQVFLAWNATADPPVSLDDVPGLTAEEVLAQTRAEALPALTTRADVTGLQVRTVADAIQTLTNDRLTFLFAQVAQLKGITPEALEAEFGRPARVLAPEILAYIGANPTAGDPAAPT